MPKSAKLLTLTVFLFLSLSASVHSQHSTALYDTTVNAMKQIDSLVSVAGRENKHVFLQVGGNWCKWCRKFAAFTAAEAEVDSLLKADFVVGHINYSKENKNPEAMKRLGYPQRFGFPVFVILDPKGNRIHTQNSGYLESGEGYDNQKVTEFLKQWNPNAIRDSSYK